MNKNAMLNAINGIDEDLINKYFEIGKEADVKKEKTAKRSWIKWGALAACFVLILTICILPTFDFSGSSNYLLAITAYADDGTEQRLETNQMYLKSSISGKEAFGKDVSIFEFYVAPVERNEEGDIFEKYDIEISYGGKVVKNDDEHIKILFVAHQSEIYGIGRYGILGWFDETTDVIITLKDKKNGNVVEKMTVNIKYSKAEGSYRLTLTDVYNVADK